MLKVFLVRAPAASLVHHHPQLWAVDATTAICGVVAASVGCGFHSCGVWHIKAPFATVSGTPTLKIIKCTRFYGFPKFSLFKGALFSFLAKKDNLELSKHCFFQSKGIFRLLRYFS
jgi:hypothetical protein